MSQRVNLKQLEALLSGSLDDIRQATRVVTQAKDTFTEAYGERERRYQQRIGPLVDEVVAAWEEAGTALHSSIAARLEKERRTLEARRQELRAEVLPQIQEDVDGFITESQTGRARYQEHSRRLKAQEAQLLSEIEAGEAELDALNTEIEKQGCLLGMIRHLGTLRKLSRRRKALLQTLKEKQEALGTLRREWKERRTQFEAEQASLQTRIQEGLQKRAELRAELDYLDDEAQRELLARQRAARHVLNALREPIVSPPSELQEKVNALIALNIERDHYREGLMKAAHLAGLFAGIGKGVQAFQTSVQKLYQQQQRYRQYLHPLKIKVPEAAAAFLGQFRQLPQALHTADPVTFATRAEAVIADAEETQIQETFESLGEALNQATRTQWK
ncbi:MAG: hypothetical protein ACP5HM_07965 [Anaerolineae bacterium]